MNKLIIIMFLISTLLSMGCSSKSIEFQQTDLSVSDSESGRISQADTSDVETAFTDPSAEEDCFIYICGAVNQPGVYSLKANSRVFQAIEAAGGLTIEASFESINQAKVLVDGEMIRILTKEEAEQMISVETDNMDEQGKDTSQLININRADQNSLMTLPGIGESKAESIVSYRSENGKFSSVEEIKNIPGIKDGVYEKIKDKITVD